MPPLVSNYLLARAQKRMNTGLIEQATNSRTGATLSCRISSYTREMHLTGLPNTRPFVQFILAFPAGSDVQQGDIITVTNQGSFYVTLNFQPRSFVIVARYYAVRLVGDTPATFTKGSNTLTTSIVVVQSDPSVVQATGQAQYAYALYFDDTLRFANGARIDGRTLVSWGEMAMPVSIESVVRTHHGSWAKALILSERTG